MNSRLGVAFLWHMHQPVYRDGSGRFRLPWCYLHAVKDYADMAAHLEIHPEVRVTVNWTPTLLEQLADYAERLRIFLREGKPVGDELLDWLGGGIPLPSDLKGRQRLVAACRRANPPTMVHPFALFHQLSDLVGEQRLGGRCNRLLYLNEQFLFDLLVWYHLAWCGAALRQRHPTIRRLMEKGCGFSGDDRRALMEVIAETIAGITNRYRALAERGQIELSMTPYGHPIAPLLLDFSTARESRPEDPLPNRNYPGGEERLRWHIEEGLASFTRVFGIRPLGVWPAEGAVCERSVELYAEYGFRWCASGENVWRASAEASKWDSHFIASKRGLFAPISWREKSFRLLFRDDGLSDLIGFQYQHWRTEDAVSHFVNALEGIAEAFGLEAGEHTVLVALDGENAWEFYPNNGWDFLELLYGRLAYHPRLQLRTISEAVAARRSPNILSRLRAGSWVQGNLATWIGSRAKNEAWEALGRLKETADQMWPKLSPTAQRELAYQMGLCEASDWFWWFADHNPTEAVAEFDEMFRSHLVTAYRLMGVPPPKELEKAFATGGGAAELGGTMQRGS